MLKMDSVKLLTVIIIVSMVILMLGLGAWALRLNGVLPLPYAAA